MTVFLPLFLKIFPLYFLIALGYVGQRYLKIEIRSLARIMIFLISPVVVFNSGFTAPLQGNILILPLIFGGTISMIALLSAVVGPFFFKDSTKNLFAFASANSNTGYFGLPLVLSLLGQDFFTLAVLTSLGSLLYENSLGVFLLARGRYSVKQSFIQVLRLPAIYAILAGSILNVVGFNSDAPVYTDFITFFKGTFVVLGMMIIGCGIASVQKISFDKRLLTLGFFAKFGLTPLFMAAVLWIDFHMGGWLSPEGRSVLWILSLCPVAANTVAYATELKIHPEKAATLVFLSTIFALFYIPVAVGFM